MSNITIVHSLHPQATMELANKHASDPAALKVIFNILLLTCKIFYSLNFQVSIIRIACQSNRSPDIPQ